MNGTGSGSGHGQSTADCRRARRLHPLPTGAPGLPTVKIAVEGAARRGPRLFNPYGIIAVNPGAIPTSTIGGEQADRVDHIGNRATDDR